MDFFATLRIVFGTSLLLFLVIAGFQLWWLLIVSFRNRNKKLPHPKTFRRLPAVTIQLPIYNELFVVRQLLRSVTNLEYPRNLLEIQVLDDSTDKTSSLLERLVKRYRGLGFNITYFHRPHNIGFKAGGLNLGLKYARGEFLLILDADFLPFPDFLKKTIHYFTHPKVGIVQARWKIVNEDHSLLTHALTAILDRHSIIDQLGRFWVGRFIKFQGSGGIIRKACLLEVGGWDEEVMIEDIELSYLSQLKGWKILFLDDVEIGCQVPVTSKAYVVQQYRWNKGMMEVFCKLTNHLVKVKLSWGVKSEALLQLGRGGLFSFFYFIVFIYLLTGSVERIADNILSWVLVLGVMFLIFIPFFLGSIFSSWYLDKPLLKTVFLSLLIPFLYAGALPSTLLGSCEAVIGTKSRFCPRTPKNPTGGTFVKNELYKSPSRYSILSFLFALLLLLVFLLTFAEISYPARLFFPLVLLGIFSFGFF